MYLMVISIRFFENVTNLLSNVKLMSILPVLGILLVTAYLIIGGDKNEVNL